MRQGRKYLPLKDDHPVIGDPCAACKKPFKAGDETTLIPLGPGDDPEAQRLAREGLAYNAVATLVHWDCSGMVEEE